MSYTSETYSFIYNLECDSKPLDGALHPDEYIAPEKCHKQL